MSRFDQGPYGGGDQPAMGLDLEAALERKKKQAEIIAAINKKIGYDPANKATPNAVEHWE